MGTAAGALTTAACQQACAAKNECKWWVLRNATASKAQIRTSCGLVFGKMAPIIVI